MTDQIPWPNGLMVCLLYHEQRANYMFVCLFVFLKIDYHYIFQAGFELVILLSSPPKR